jgi:Cys-tRNA(Pro)/Cys-tRNA(Cys) deacylase
MRKRVTVVDCQIQSKMQKISKTNVARLLDNAKIQYELVPYEVDENDLSAIHVAEQLGENPEQVFKTLVLEGNKTRYFVCIVPGDSEIDLKKAAAVSGNKSCTLIHQKDLLSVAGYIRGACSPIGMKKHYPTYIHQSCMDYPYIFVSAGQRGLQLKISPSDLISVTKAQISDLILKKAPSPFLRILTKVDIQLRLQ